MKARLLIVLLALFAFSALLSSCSDSPAESQAKLSSGGDYIGKLPDGREVRRFCLSGPGWANHYIYVLTGSTSVSYAAGTTVNLSVIDASHP